MLDELAPERCWLELAGLELGHLGVISEGEPYVTPVSFVVFPPTGDEPGSIRFRTVSGRRLRALEAGSRACFEAAEANPGTGAWVSVLAWGGMRSSVTPRDEQETIQALLRKYHGEHEDPFRLPAPSLEEPSVVIIDVDEISGRSSGWGLRPGIRPGRL